MLAMVKSFAAQTDNKATRQNWKNKKRLDKVSTRQSYPCKY